MKNNFSLLIVDDHSVVRQGASLSLKKHFPGITIYNASDFEQTIDVLEQTPSVDLVLLDINIPGGNSTDMIAQIRALHNEIKILIFSAYEEQHYAMRYIRAGANGYLNKNGEEEEIIYAVNEVLSKGEYVSEELREKSWEAFQKEKQIPHHTLADEKDEVVEKLIQYIKSNINNSNLDVDDLCQQLGMSRTSLYRKLKAVTNYSATAFVRKVRLDVAAELLRQPDARISEVAFNCGFNTHSHFSQCFAKEFDMSPKDYMASLK